MAFKFKFGALQKSVFWQEGQSPLDLAKPSNHDQPSARAGGSVDLGNTAMPPGGEGRRAQPGAAPSHGLRSIAEECETNDGGRWKLEYAYVAEGKAREGCWEFARGAKSADQTVHCSWPAVRDRNHGGTYGIEFDNGSRDDAVPARAINKLLGDATAAGQAITALRVGDMVEARCKGSKKPLPGKIVVDNGDGMTLDSFVRHPAAVAAGLTQAEVAMLRLYTGPMYQPLNGALRGQGGPSALRRWWTCITVLISAVFKVSFISSDLAVDPSITKFGSAGNDESRDRDEVSRVPTPDPDTSGAPPTPPVARSAYQVDHHRISLQETLEIAGGPREVFRGLPVESLTVCDEASSDGELNFERDGGVELAFCSTTKDPNVAIAFAKGKKGVLLRFKLSSTTRGAGVQWLSQYPEESEWLLPPFTMFKPVPDSRKGKMKPIENLGNMRELHFEATVRVPFQELNMQVPDVRTRPRLPERDDAAISPSAEADHFEKLLQTEFISSGFVALQRGFFGGCNMKSVALFAVIGLGLFGISVAMAVTIWSKGPMGAGSNGPYISALVSLGALGLATVMWRYL